MAKRHAKRVYLGTTRRQKNTRRMTFWITVSLTLVIVVASAAFFAWMLDEDNAPAVPPTDDTQTGEADGTVIDDDADMGADSAPADTDTSQKESVTVTGTPYKANNRRDEWIVMLDAGHGFDDIGTTSALLGDVNEATVNLDIVLRVAEILEASGVTVCLTHDTNAVDGRVSVSLGGEMPSQNLVLLTPRERTVLANESEIDLFVSVHCDSIPDKPEVSGMRMYYCNTENDLLTKARNSGAEALSCHIADGFFREMGEACVLPRIRALTEEQAYYVIRTQAVPSVLCEVGFVTNKTDAENILSEKWRQKAAQGIADGIIKYITAAE